jgi:4-carboxymuconolactone decarboxylase
MDASEKRKKGAAVFEEVIGYPPPEKGPDFLKLTVENLFADVWAREGLSIRDRRLVTLTVLALMGKRDSLEGHLRAALKSDLSYREVEELMIHLAHYAGWPVGQMGFEAALGVHLEMRAAEKARKAAEAKTGEGGSTPDPAR